ncbi:uncharacterized protein EV420DRAFT_1642679 [Desarmillaria tabescens]|uniref:HNH nuclease domain-containing protein n=1 Tax=Armillaria tabescens TaxID=1929756 RepID=A0AA39KFF1_ARMTA|nr:uncharacterized protein EV420DRAFT_1642679 [Desarmillaria tabescens]KAK0458970.1 hypothetical protein EV420DRAFT_1642679 [Desarmillaria tabescens]
MSNSQPCYELFVFPDGKDGEFLKIPIIDVAYITKRPVKFLQFVGYCVLGVNGRIMSKGAFMGDDEVITEGKYYFVVPQTVASRKDSHLVDPDVLMEIGEYINSCSLDWTSDAHREFTDKVVARDCSGLVMNNVPSDCGSAHIIPCARGDAATISQARPRGNESEITDIHDVRNGLLLFLSIKELFTKDLVLIRTPNAVLNHDDLLLHETSITRNLNMQGITDENYVSLAFIWLRAEGPPPILFFDDNTPGVGSRDKVPSGSRHRYGPLYEARSSLPAGFLLEFMFGALAVRLWASKSLRDRLKTATHAMYPSRVPDVETETDETKLSPEQQKIFLAMDAVMALRSQVAARTNNRRGGI